MELLNQRKLNILKAIVKDYIETAEAVGSRTISKKHDLGISAATIRNEMADLEEMGYLIQPHTSAGRVPSEEGYKLYVDSLMNEADISLEEKIMIENCVNEYSGDLKDLMQHVGPLLSRLTKYTTFAVSKQVQRENIIRNIQLVNMSDHEILLVVVTDSGDIKKAHIQTNACLEQSKLNIISNSLNSKLVGKNIIELDERLIAFIKHEIGEHSNIIDVLLNKLDFDEKDLFTVSGATNILNYPEFTDVIKAKSFLRMVEKQDNISKMINSKGIEKENVKIIIGSDNDCELAKDYAIVSASYNIKDQVGEISFIGPTRMDYSRIYAIVNYMNLLFNKNR
ncbi:MAG: heat-inducible transcriptional repressor HrcA [Peptostreptococcaceae bacterium]